MTAVWEFLAVALLFVLRLLVPVALAGALAWWLRRLDARWSAEAEADSRARLDVLMQTAVLPEPAEANRVPCWVMRNCPEERRENCAAFKTPALPCWLVRHTVEGALPTRCASCARFQPEAAKVMVHH